MNIFVCVKQVPDTETKIQISDDNSGIKTDAIKWVINPYDEFAIEESLKLKASLGAEKVYAISVGPQKRLQDSLRIALAMGCDEGITVDTEKSFDCLNTAKMIQLAIEKTGEQALVLTGKSSIDDNSQAFTQTLAALMDMPHATAVTKIHFDGSNFEVEREAEAGSKEIYQIQGPCVLGATKGLNNPRYPSLPGIMKAKKKPITNYSLEDIGFSETPSLKYTNYQPPAPNPPTQILDGEVDSQVAKLVDLLKNEAKVL